MVIDCEDTILVIEQLIFEIDSPGYQYAKITRD